MGLPIDLIPGTSPPRFRWRQTLTTPIGTRVVDHEGRLPLILEGAVLELIGIAKQRAKELKSLSAAQETTLNPPRPPTSAKKGK